MGGMTQTLTGAAMTENYEEPKKSLESQLDSDMEAAKSLVERAKNLVPPRPNVRWPTCQPGLPIELLVHFRYTCEWEATLWGSTVR